MAKVSFILPAYKRRFLHEAIASILAQTCRDFELVVVDDCSPENLKEVVDEFHDDRLSYHKNETNIGGKDLVAAWNHAMEYAQGEWCVLASDDDVWLPECLEQLVVLTEKHPLCDLFHARCAYIDADGKWSGIALERIELESQIQMVYERGVRRSQQQAPDFMFRISAWKEIGGFVKFPLAWYSDDATWMMLAKNGCAHTSDVVFCFRESGINLSSSHDTLIMPKIDAGVQFLDWVERFSKSLTPTCKEDEFLLSLIHEKLPSAVFGLMDWEISEVISLSQWLKVLSRKDIPSSLKRSAIYRRYPFIMGVRQMLARRRK